MARWALHLAVKAKAGGAEAEAATVLKDTPEVVAALDKGVQVIPHTVMKIKAVVMLVAEETRFHQVNPDLARPVAVAGLVAVVVLHHTLAVGAVALMVEVVVTPKAGLAVALKAPEVMYVLTGVQVNNL
jgi:hypothetical protein